MGAGRHGRLQRQGAPNHLNLTGKVVAQIFLGEITTWNDPADQVAEPRCEPAWTHITPIYRWDGSGASCVFTGYLSAVNPGGDQVGASTSPRGPRVPRPSRARASRPSRHDGAITYAAMSYIAADRLNEALIQNAAGKYPPPTTRTASWRPPRVATTRPDGTIPLVDPPASAPMPIRSPPTRT